MNFSDEISCHNFVVIDRYAYFSNCFFNGFFRVEIKTGKSYFLGCFKDEKICAKNIHKEVFERDLKIYFCPRKGRHVHIYGLVDKSMLSIVVRKKSEPKYLIEEVVCGDKYIYFLPEQKGYPIKVLDLKAEKVFEIHGNFKPQGVYLSRCKDLFPDYKLIEKCYKNKYSNFFWKQIFSEEWYAFLPIGRKLLKYKREGNQFEEIPLQVVNDTELERYIYKVRAELLKEKTVLETRMELSIFIKCIKSIKKHEDNAICINDIGNIIWNSRKNI